MSDNRPERPYDYDVFISYRSASSGSKALQVRKVLHALSKRHADANELIQIFLDLNSLMAGSLNDNIDRALRSSRCLLLLVDSTTRESPWVTKEITQWLEEGGSPERLFLVRNDESLDLSWDSDHGTFVSADVLPPPLRSVFPAEQKWFDVSVVLTA